MQKWNEPKGPIPPWLDPSEEITHDGTMKLSKHGFVVASVDACVTLGCSVRQAAGVTANAINESAWGQSYNAFNLGGWKCTKAAADAAKLTGKTLAWWRAPGNKAPGATLTDLKGGDPPWCYYRAFHSLGEFLDEWMVHFTPHPGEMAPYQGYKACGTLFWTGGEWFPELIRVGYKGVLTKKKPEGAIADHRSLVNSALVIWVQAKLGIAIDGVWGPQSRTAYHASQAAHGLPPTDVFDDKTLAALSIS